MATIEKKQKTLLLIDANSLIHRCFHAIPPLTGPDGAPTNALYGIANILYKLFQSDAPDYAAAAFDRPEPTFRKKEYDAYKAHRPPTADTLVTQLIEAHNLFRAFGIQTFEKAGFEADDIIGTLATIYKNKPDIKVTILTGDLDSLQLIEDGRIQVKTFKKGIADTMVYTSKEVEERYGLPPTQLIDYKALVGDTSDNIKGVPGVGPKTASQLIQKYKTVEGILEHSETDEKIKEKITPYAKQLLIAKMLVTIKKDVPLETTLEALQTEGIATPNQLEYCREKGFESLLARMKKGDQGVQTKKEKITASSVVMGGKKQSLFAEKNEMDEIYTTKDGVIITGVNPDIKKIATITGKKIGFDLKTFIKKSQERGVEVGGPFCDLGVGYWLLDPDNKDISPEQCAKKLGKKEWTGTQQEYEELYEEIMKRLKKYELLSVFEDIEMKVLPVLAQMERWGIGVSVKKLVVLEKEIEKHLKAVEKKIYQLAGREFNINSPQQVSGILFETLGIKTKKSSKNKQGNFSTDAQHLEEVADQHPIVKEILEYREHFKIQSTYVRAIQGLVDEKGRLHTQYVQTGAGTGRLSSKDPNLQNIPQESQWSKAFRSAFESASGTSFLSLDYSQLELRILAAVTGDPQMTKAFLEGEDIHAKTAHAVLGIPVADVTKEQRRMAKTLNFGLIYGMGVTAFAKATGVTRTQAQEFMKKYFDQFPTVKRWQEALLKEIHKTGYATTLTGRRRYFEGIQSHIPQLVAASERAALNFPLQGLGADSIKIAMISVEKALKERKWWGSKAKLLLTIHDELLLEVADDMIEEVKEVVKNNMESVLPQLSVPLTVEAATGKSWGEMEKLK